MSNFEKGIALLCETLNEALKRKWRRKIDFFSALRYILAGSYVNIHQYMYFYDAV